jgi:hypothetical protein
MAGSPARVAHPSPQQWPPQPVDLTFEFGDLLLSLGQRTGRIRNLIDRDHSKPPGAVRRSKPHN